MLLAIACQSAGNEVPMNKERMSIAQPQSIDTSHWKPTTVDIVNNLKGVSMTTKVGTVSPTKVTVVFENTAKRHYIYGTEFQLEGKIDDIWYTVPAIREGTFNAIGIILFSESQRDLTIDWGWLYGTLNPGEYRVLKRIIDSRAPGDYDSFVLAAEFTILQ